MITIRLATAADIAAVGALEHQQYAAEGYPAAFLLQALRQWPQLFWVAELSVNGKTTLAGYVLAAPASETAEFWIMSVLVAPAARGQQVGKLLMQRVMADLAPSAKKLWLSVAPNNTAAQKLYLNLGFQQQYYAADYLGIGEHRDILCYQP